MTTEKETRMLTVAELMTMAAALVEVDGEIHEAETKRLAQIEAEYDPDATVPYAEAMLVLKRLAGVDGEDDSAEHLLIRDLIDAHASGEDDSAAGQAEDEALPEHEAKASTEDEATEPFDPTANLPIPPVISSSTVRLTCGFAISTSATATPKPSTTCPCRLNETL